MKTKLSCILATLGDALHQGPPVFELPGGWGVEPPSCLLNPPNKMPWDTLGGQFQPLPPWLMMLNRLCVMTMTMNRQMSTLHLFFDNSNPGVPCSFNTEEDTFSATLMSICCILNLSIAKVASYKHIHEDFGTFGYRRPTQGRVNSINVN
jgi:hypothetical protein